MLIDDARKGHGAGAVDPVELVARSLLAFQELSTAWHYAQDRGDNWQFSIELESLLSHGLTNNDLRWLVSGAYLHHVIETSGRNGNRQFRAGGGRFELRSCFMFTDAGETLFQSALLKLGRPKQETPIWDAERHQLRVGESIVKEFRLRAHNQEAILDAFEREHWVRRIADPLPAGTGSKQRLHDTIKCLNRSQLARLIAFRGDGTGQGVCWEFVHPPTASKRRKTKR
jgi:hypothetical protein